MEEKKEIEELKTLYSSNEAELVAVYGRRRVGKTFLINEVFKDKFTFVHSGLSPIEVLNSTSRASDQLLHFYHSLVSTGMKKRKIPSNWLEAFYMLETFLSSINNGERQLFLLMKFNGWILQNRAL